MTATYDPHADWYAEYVQGAAAAYTERVAGVLSRLLRRGSGRCVDIGCGTGVHAASMRRLGWQVVGVDVSLGQLRHARQHLPVAAGDSAALPFATASADLVTAILIQTDVPDWAVTVREAGRVLRGGGSFVSVGVHPCFVGPFADRDGDLLRLHPGYHDRELTHTGPGLGSGIRPRVGVRHRTVGDLLNAVCAAGLVLAGVEEHGSGAFPDLFAFVATKQANGDRFGNVGAAPRRQSRENR
jgi:SAM-dependent methyltransferase